MEVIAFLGYIAGGLVSVGIIWTKGIVPLARFIKHVDSIYESVEKLPEWCAGVDETLGRLDTLMTEHIDGHDHTPAGV